MTTLQVLIVLAGQCASGLAVAGLLLRGDWRIARGLTAYLGFMFVVWNLILAWPARFWTWDFWVVKQIVYDALELAIACELAYWVFMGFPGAARSARVTMLFLLAATFVAVFQLPNENAGGPGAGAMLADVRPRLELGIAAVYATTLLLVRRYSVPLHPLHEAILTGMVVWLCGFGLFVHAMGVWGLEFATGEPIVTLAPASFAVVTWWWAWRAWRPAPMPVASEGLVELLQPWRVR